MKYRVIFFLITFASITYSQVMKAEVTRILFKNSTLNSLQVKAASGACVHSVSHSSLSIPSKESMNIEINYQTAPPSSCGCVSSYQKFTVLAYDVAGNHYPVALQWYANEELNPNIRVTNDPMGILKIHRNENAVESLIVEVSFKLDF